MLLSNIGVGDCDGNKVALTSTSAGTVIAARSGARFVVTAILIDSSGSAVANGCTIGGTAFSAAPVIPVPASSGAVVSLVAPIRGAANTAITATLGTSPSGTVNVTLVGFWEPIAS